MRRCPSSRFPSPRPLVLALLLAPLLAGCAARIDHAVVPVPGAIRVDRDAAFTLDTLATIAVLAPAAGAAGGEAPAAENGAEDGAAMRVARGLAELIGTTRETTPRVLAAGDAGVGEADIVLALDPGAAARLGPEGYTLRVDGTGVRIDAAAPAGLFYGAQTLRQLLPPEVEYTAARPRPLAVPHARVEDRPRYAWRGAMLDVSRHFFEVEEVKRYIDLLAMHKLNRLHLHLADDQGWRIEVPGWPRLTEHGGSTEVGGGPGGFYTTEEYRELVRYAADRFVTVVPEIDMPGHTNAALASYPALNCDGVSPPLYTGIQVGFSALCVESEATWEFVDAVVGHLAANTPGPWIHIGGDEVEELTEEEYAHFIERVQEIVHRHGKTMVGWGEIAAADLAPRTLIQHWRGTGEELAGAWAGQVILSPATNVYLDMKYHDAFPIGLAWAGLTPLRKAYEWDPAAIIPGLPANAIAGIEAPLWAETIGTVHDLESMAFPRLAAIAELAWSPADATDWDAFRRRLARHGLRWTILGVNYYRSPDVEWETW